MIKKRNRDEFFCSEEILDEKTKRNYEQRGKITKKLIAIDEDKKNWAQFFFENITIYTDDITKMIRDGQMTDEVNNILHKLWSLFKFFILLIF